jgi:hypothetical protein
MQALDGGVTIATRRCDSATHLFPRFDTKRGGPKAAISLRAYIAFSQLIAPCGSVTRYLPLPSERFQPPSTPRKGPAQATTTRGLRVRPPRRGRRTRL